MGISINGLGSSDAYNAYVNAEKDLSSTQQEVASGSSLTASSDPSGLSIDTLLKAQTSGLQTASQNAQNGISLLQTADGALGQTSSLLQQIRTLAVQAGNGTNDATSLAAIGAQVTQSLSQIDQISASTNFNGTNLLDGSQANGLTFQTGDGTGASATTSAALPNTSSTALGLSGIAGTITSRGDISSVLSAIDNASSSISGTQTTVGATVNDLSNTIGGLSGSVANLQSASADSSIGDVDMAQASTKMASDSIKSQFAMSLMAQTNSLNQQSALALLKTI